MVFAICVLILALFVISVPAIVLICFFYPDLGVKIMLAALLVATLAWGVVQSELAQDKQDEVKGEEVLPAEIERKSA